MVVNRKKLCCNYVCIVVFCVEDSMTHCMSQRRCGVSVTSEKSDDPAPLRLALSQFIFLSMDLARGPQNDPKVQFITASSL